MPRHPRPSDIIAPLPVPAQAGIAFVLAQGIAPGGNIIEHAVKAVPAQALIGRSAADFSVEVVGAKRPAAGGAQDMLRQHIQSATAGWFTIQFTVHHGLRRGLAFQYFKAVGGYQQGAAGFIQSVIGPTDPLYQAAQTLGRADLDNQIHRAPVDTQIQGRGTDHRPQIAAHHGRLHLAALPHIQRAVMQRDCQAVFVQAPQVIENHLGLGPGVDEDKRGLLPANGIIDVRHGMQCHMAGPRHPGRSRHDLDFGPWAGAAIDHRHRSRTIEKTRHLFRGGHRRGKTDLPGGGRHAGQPSQAQGEEVATLIGGKGMQFVDHHITQVGKIPGRIPIRQQQGQLFRRGQQDVRRIAALPLPPGLRCVPGPAFHPDRHRHLPYGHLQVTAHIHRQRLQG